MFDPIYCKKGAKVALVRGARIDTSNGPLEAGEAMIVVKDKSGNVQLVDGDDGEARPLTAPNPSPAPVGVCIGTPDNRNNCPVRFESGAWAMVPYAQLDLIEPAPEDKSNDPVVARSRELQAIHQHIEEVKNQGGAGGMSKDEQTRLSIAEGNATEAWQQIRSLFGVVDELSRRVSVLEDDLSARQAAKAAAAAAPAARFVTQADVDAKIADATAALAAMITSQKTPEAAPATPSTP